MQPSNPSSNPYISLLALAGLVALAAPTPAQKLAGGSWPIADVPTLTLSTAPSTASVGPRAALTIASLPRFDRVLHDESPEGVLWVRGQRYKASFGPQGTTFVPFLGSDAPRNFPVTLSLRSADASGTEIAFARGVQATRRGDTITFDRGVMREVYDVSFGRVEQSFDLDARVADGDLTLLIGFETELAAAVTERGVSFTNELGGVDATHAVAIDATGRRLELALSLSGDAIEIDVPDAWLDGATFPVRIDPTFTTYNVSSVAEFQHDTDVTFDNTTSRTTVVWEEDFSGTDHDVGYCVLDTNGSPIASAYIDFTSSYWSQPRVGHVTALLRALTVATKGIPGGITEIWGRQTNTDGLFSTAQFQIDTGVPGNGDQPDVGGDHTFDQSHPLCVVWRREVGSGFFAIAVRTVSSLGVPLGTGGDMPTPVGGESKPRISDTHDGSNWTVVWQRDAGVTDHDIFVGRPNFDLSSVPTAAVSVSTDDEINPSVSCTLNGSSQYMIVFEKRTFANSNVMAYLMSGTATSGTLDLSVSDGSAVDDTVEPVASTDGRHFDVSYRLVPTSAIKVIELWCIVSPLTIGLAQSTVQIVAGADARAQLAAYRSTGGPGNQRRLAAVYGQSGDVKLALLQNRIGGDVFPACFGDGTGANCPCSNNGIAGHGCANSLNAQGALLSTGGNAGLGAEDTLVLLGSGMPAGSSCLYFQGTNLAANGTVFGDGLRCAQGTVVRLGTKLNDISGASQYPAAGDQQISIRGGLPVGGAARGYQVWYRNAATFCTTSTFNLSNGIYATFAP